MTRYAWSELPSGARAAIERETGAVLGVVQPSAGRNSDFSAALHLADRVVFCKGIADSDGTRARMHQHEADVAPHLPASVAPALLWRVEQDGWLLLGFEHVTGQHADLSPGSADLPRVAATATTLACELAHSPIRAPRIVDQWARLAAWRHLAKAPLPSS